MTDFSDPQVLGAILGGGLAGAILNQIASEGLRWLRKPTLQVRFSKDAEGCVADTPTADPQTGTINGKQRYLRLRVENTGRTTAQRVSACMTLVDYRSKSGQHDIFAREVIELKFAMGPETEKTLGAVRIDSLTYLEWQMREACTALLVLKCSLWHSQKFSTDLVNTLSRLSLPQTMQTP